MTVKTGKKQVSGKKPISEARLAALRPTQWRPGQSGNPGGRPRKLPISDALREILETIDPKDRQKRTFGALLAQKLLDEVLKKKGKLPISIVQEIADRVEGKPTQRTELTGAEGQPLFLPPATREELEQRLAALMAGKGQETAPKEP
jgi:hypothetical protein